ncbi:MAG: PD40 domain-containing protein [Robiginitomaculum sp.]|nr:PD40 domain-containing protein [Robiginitomaculum sp.]
MTIIKHKILSTIAGFAIGGTLMVAPVTAQEQTFMLGQPDLSARHIAFVYAGDIWIAKPDGSNPRRLTSHPANEGNVKFSPDGKMLAFTASFDGNDDVYVMSVAGGQPKRLTFHPSRDRVTGWTPDGMAVTFSSNRETKFGRSGQIYHVQLTGGLPTKQMEARFFNGSWSPDGEKLAYTPNAPAYNGLYGGSSGWRQYRGGASPSINILTPVNQTLEYIPGDRVNDLNPMWVNGQVWFISDRDNQSLNLFSYDQATKVITQHTDEGPWDVRWAGAHGSNIVFEAGGRLKQLDTTAGTVSEISISIRPDLEQLRPKWKNLSKQVERIGLSPSAKRAVLTARGEVFTVPLEDGSTRNLTGTDGVREFDALWSPDGDTIAYIDDKNGVYSLVIRDQRGEKTSRKLALGSKNAKAFYTLLNWGGAGEHIIYQDNHLNLYAIKISNGSRVKIATNTRRAGFGTALSPDGTWLAYTLEQPNFLADLMVYSFSSGQSTKVSDGMSDTGSPTFSPDGKTLYFTASTNSGPAQVGLDMSSQERPYRAGIYALVLSAEDTSPLLPKTGDEEEKKKDKNKNNNGKDDEEEKIVTKIDLDGVGDRIVALPLPERNYDTLNVSEKGALYYVERTQPGITNEPRGSNPQVANKLKRFDFKELKSKTLASEIGSYSMSADGKHLIIQKIDNAIVTAETGEELKPEPLKLGDLRAFIDPRHEWEQIFEEVWRMERDFFYATNMHGLDWQAVRDRYKPLLSHVGRREDLTRLLVEMIAEMQVGHNRTGGGDIHNERRTNTGLLGADLRVENDRYRIKKIFTGESWNPFLMAPLAAPGLGVKEGDYILALNGRVLTGKDNIFAMLEGRANTQLSLRISTTGADADARDIIVKPTASERELRHWAWVEGNRKWIDEQSGGKVGYVYLPNTAGGGFTYFNRMMFAQSDREAMIFDERANGGGQAANYIIDVLRRVYLSGWKDRAGKVFNTPGGAVYGPKVMLIDQDAGSGGDYMPYAFRHTGIGKLIGTRTWGGLIGISANPRLIDGGFLTVPYFRFFDPDGNWTIENEGVAPDIRVELDPAAYNQGRDMQLERGLEEVLNQLKTYQPLDLKTAPADPTELGK